MKGIPEDTPENTVKAIAEIIREEAESIGATFDLNLEKGKTSAGFTIQVTHNDRYFRVILKAVPGELLERTYGTIGNGLIAGTAISGCWNLELLPQDITLAPFSPPFRWGVYRENDDYLTTPPTHILDGPLLRRFLRESLTSQLPPSP